jgi:hypothetical protein
VNNASEFSSDQSDAPSETAVSDDQSDGGLAPVDPIHPWNPAGPNPDYTVGFTCGYAKGFQDAARKYEEEESDVDEMALTFSYADLTVLGLGFLAVMIPVGILLSRTERPTWKLPWS